MGHNTLARLLPADVWHYSRQNIGRFSRLARDKPTALTPLLTYAIHCRAVNQVLPNLLHSHNIRICHLSQTTKPGFAKPTALPPYSHMPSVADHRPDFAKPTALPPFSHMPFIADHRTRFCQAYCTPTIFAYAIHCRPPNQVLPKRSKNVITDFAAPDLMYVSCNT